MILELYDNTKTYMYPSGRLATPAAVEIGRAHV